MSTRMMEPRALPGRPQPHRDRPTAGRGRRWHQPKPTAGSERALTRVRTLTSA